MILKVKLKQNPYDVVIGRGQLNEIEKYLNLKRKVLILTDSGVPKEYALKVKNKCDKGVIFTIESGEQSKNLENFSKIIEKMIENDFTRKDCVMAVGGGVVGDLAGFVASSYMRGVDFYNIPTTLLSCVDSSVGGKVAVDFNGIKNIVGAFYQPKKVVVDVNLLKTLDKRQFINGLVEAIKISLTSSKKLFELISDIDNIENNLEEIIALSLKLKKGVVEKDEKEKNLRKILNFGHTIGHGVESYFSGELLHGECVALGMLCFCSEDVKTRLKSLLTRLGLKTKITADREKILQFIKHDKKANLSFVSVVMVDRIGSYYLREMELKEISENIGEIL